MHGHVGQRERQVPNPKGRALDDHSARHDAVMRLDENHAAVVVIMAAPLVVLVFLVVMRARCAVDALIARSFMLAMVFMPVPAQQGQVNMRRVTKRLAVLRFHPCMHMRNGRQLTGELPSHDQQNKETVKHAEDHPRDSNWIPRDRREPRERYLRLKRPPAKASIGIVILPVSQSRPPQTCRPRRRDLILV